MHAIKHTIHTCTLRLISLVAYRKLVMSLEYERFSKDPRRKDHSPSMSLDVAFDKTISSLTKLLERLTSCFQ